MTYRNGNLHEDFDMSGMSEIDWTDAMSDSDINAEIEHVWRWINRHVVIYVDPSDNYDMCSSTSIRYSNDSGFAGPDKNMNDSPYAMEGDPYIRINQKKVSDTAYKYVIDIGKYGNASMPVGTLPILRSVSVDFMKADSRYDTNPTNIKFGEVDCDFEIAASHPDEVFGNIGDPVPEWFPDSINGAFLTGTDPAPLRSDGALLDIIPSKGVTDIVDHAFDFSQFYDSDLDDFYADAHSLAADVETIEQMYYDLLSYLNHVRDLVNTGQIGSDGKLKMIEYADMNQGWMKFCPVTYVALLQKNSTIPGEYIDDVIKGLSEIIERKSAEGWIRPVDKDADRHMVYEDFDMSGMSEIDWTDAMSDADENAAVSQIYHWLWDNIDWDTRKPGEYSDEICEQIFSLRPGNTHDQFLIDVSSAAGTIRYSTESEWIYDNDAEEYKSNIPAFPSFIRFGECHCSFALSDGCCENVEITSLDGCPTIVHGDVDLCRCTSLHSLDGIPKVIYGDLWLPLEIDCGVDYGKKLRHSWFDNESSVPALYCADNKDGGCPTIWLYDDGGYGNKGFLDDIFSGVIGEFLEKMKGHLMIILCYYRENKVLYNGDEREDLAAWITHCDDHPNLIGSGGYDKEDKEWLEEDGFFDYDA